MKFHNPLGSVLSVVLLALAGAVFSPLDAAAATPDYPGASWDPASPANYSVANRPHDYPVDMIIIHDTEGSFATALSLFQNPQWQASAHYVVSQTGRVAQMVQEKDIAWGAGNWDYNTRAINIEHEGYAWTPNTFTYAEYAASAHISASICSRWGVPMDRNHVIGHNQVPDPNNPGLFGGSDHHTDPGPYWNWSLYMSLASQDANALPSPPHMVLKATAAPANRSAILTWPAARTCHVPIASYQITGQPGNIVVNVPGSATGATVTGLQNGTTYAFTVTAINSDGQDSLTTNAVSPYTVPDAPGSIAAAADNGSATLSWTVPNAEGRPIVGYQVTPYANGVPMSPVVFMQTNTTEVVAGLANGVAYTFVVAAINLAGPGTPSAVSNQVVPSAAFRPGDQQGPTASPPPRSAAPQSSPPPSRAASQASPPPSPAVR